MAELTASQTYLLTYNVLQHLGWSWLLVVTLVFFGSATLDSRVLWEQALFPVSLFQTLAVLEVFHCMLGWVKSSPTTTAIQVASRVFITWGVLWLIPESRQSVGVIFLLLAWSITEAMRYLYYALNLLGVVPSTLTWARYTLFMGLYPLGVSGELLCIFSALLHAHKYPLIFFNYYYILLLVMVSYIPLFPKMYFHMLNQRRKILGTQEKKKM